jgi:hypothetical protein
MASANFDGAGRALTISLGDKILLAIGAGLAIVASTGQLYGSKR